MLVCFMLNIEYYFGCYDDNKLEEKTCEIKSENQNTMELKSQKNIT